MSLPKKIFCQINSFAHRMMIGHYSAFCLTASKCNALNFLYRWVCECVQICFLLDDLYLLLHKTIRFCCVSFAMSATGFLLLYQHKTEHFSNFPVMSVCSFAVSIAQHAAPNWNMGSHSQWIRAVLDIVCVCPKVSYNVFCYETPLEHCIKRAFIFFPEAANSAHSWITVILMLDPTETLYGCLQ